MTYPFSRTRHSIRIGIAVLVLCLLVTGCADNVDPLGVSPGPEAESPIPPTLPRAHSVTIESVGGELRYHEEASLRAVVKDVQGRVIPDHPVAWNSDQVSAVSVSSSGVVRGEGVGSARITARAGEVEAAANFTVPGRLMSLRFDRPGFLSVMDLNHDIECAATCERTVPLGATLRLSAEPPVGVPPVRWSAPCPAGTAAECVLEVRDDLVLTITVNPPPAPTGFAQAVAVGDGFSGFACAISARNEVHCWGANTMGELGQGRFGPFSSRPIRLPIEQQFHSVTAGSSHACALTVTGAAYCWGGQWDLPLGTGHPLGRSTPRRILGNAHFIQIDAGYDHTCGVTGAGGLYCWGRNQAGQLGDDSSWDRTGPQRVASDVSFAQVSAGDRSTCAVSTRGELYCWGDNTFGQLGTGDLSASRHPRRSASSRRYLEVAVGKNTACALRTDGVVECWGNEQHGALGLASFGNRSITQPTPIRGGHRFVSLTVGSSPHACGITSTGSPLCWGTNFDGALGNGSMHSAAEPQPVAGGHRLVAIHAGRHVSCGINEGGELLCWGRPADGVLGQDVLTNAPAPMRLQGLPRAEQVLTGPWGWQCAILQGSGDLQCWGGWGPLVHKNERWRPSLQIPAMAQVTLGNNHLCGIHRQDGELRCYGHAERGALGHGMTQGWVGSEGVRVRLDEPIAQVKAGQHYTCALTEDGRVFCWGANEHGQLGDGTFIDRPLPGPVSHGSLRFIHLEVGEDRACAISSAQELWCWGGGIRAPIGDGGRAARTRPVQVAKGMKVQAVALGGGAHSCLVNEAGQAYCWGASWRGQLGSSVRGDQLLPIRVPLQESLTSLMLAGSFSCGLTKQGRLICWGENLSGQLGTGSFSESEAPTPVTGNHRFVSVSAGWRHICATDEQGTVFCWGDNSNGLLGVEVPLHPVRVSTGFRSRPGGAE